MRSTETSMYGVVISFVPRIQGVCLIEQNRAKRLQENINFAEAQLVATCPVYS